MLTCFAACCSGLSYTKLQCVAASLSFELVVNGAERLHCSVLQFVAVCCSVFSELQCVVVCCSILQRVAVSFSDVSQEIQVRVLRMCCSVLQCVAVCCSVLQCGAVRCSVVHFVAM